MRETTLAVASLVVAGIAVKLSTVVALPTALRMPSFGRTRPSGAYWWPWGEIGSWDVKNGAVWRRSGEYLGVACVRGCDGVHKCSSRWVDRCRRRRPLIPVDLVSVAVATDCRLVAVRLESSRPQKASSKISTRFLRSSPLEPGTPRGCTKPLQ